MSSRIRRFFRRCPSCGRRFEASVVAKEPLRSKDGTAFLTPPISSLAGRAAYSDPYVAMQPAGSAILSGASPVEMEEVKFEYSYKCRHCGHGWTEVH